MIVATASTLHVVPKEILVVANKLGRIIWIENQKWVTS